MLGWVCVCISMWMWRGRGQIGRQCQPTLTNKQMKAVAGWILHSPIHLHIPVLNWYLYECFRILFSIYTHIYVAGKYLKLSKILYFVVDESKLFFLIDCSKTLKKGIGFNHLKRFWTTVFTTHLFFIFFNLKASIHTNLDYSTLVLV